jgi:hypothetical protein
MNFWGRDAFDMTHNYGKNYTQRFERATILIYKHILYLVKFKATVFWDVMLVSLVESYRYGRKLYRTSRRQITADSNIHQIIKTALHLRRNYTGYRELLCTVTMLIGLNWHRSIRNFRLPPRCWWDDMQHRMVILYRRFGTECRSHLPRSWRTWPLKMGPIRCPKSR